MTPMGKESAVPNHLGGNTLLTLSRCSLMSNLFTAVAVFVHFIEECCFPIGSRDLAIN